MKKLFVLSAISVLSTVLTGCEALQNGGGYPLAYGGSPGPSYGGGYSGAYPVFADPYPYDHGYWEGVRDQERADWERERYREEAIHDAIQRQRLHDSWVRHEHDFEVAQRQHWEHQHANEVHQSAPGRQHNAQEQQRYHQEIAQQHQQIANRERADAEKNAQHQREIRERQIREVESHRHDSH